MRQPEPLSPTPGGHPGTLAFQHTNNGNHRRRGHVQPLLVGACLFALSAGPAFAKEWFVSTTGNDSSGTGTQAKPYRTVSRVLSTSNGVVGPGDTVTLRGPSGNNTYNECDVRLRMKLTLRSYPGEMAHIHCNVNTPDSVTVQIDPDASGSRLSRLEISGSQYYGVMMQTNWEQGTSGTGASNIVLEDLLIHDTGRDGIKITPKSNNVTIRRSEIHHTGAAYPPGTDLEDKNADGIDNVNGSGMVVEDSYIHDIATTGLYFKGGASDVLVQRNRIENTGIAGILVGFDTSVDYFDLQANPSYYESIRGTVRNNVIRTTNYAGIGLYAAKDAVVANNTIVDAGKLGHAGLYFGVTFQDWDPKAKRPPSVNPTLRNNLVIQNGGNCVEIRYSDELGGLSGLSGSPGSNYNGFQNSGCLYRDARPGSSLSSGGSLAQWRSATRADGNSLQARFDVDATGKPRGASPASGAGMQVQGVTDDINDDTRDQPPSIGAYEHASMPGAAAASATAINASDVASATAAPVGPVAAGQSPGLIQGGTDMSLPIWLVAAIAAALALTAVGANLVRRRNVAGWLGAWLRQDWRAPVSPGTTRHLLFCFVDHYEPAWGKPGLAKERARVARWRRDLPMLCAGHCDADGRPPVHSFFFPEEEYRSEHIDALVELCRLGLGEIEIHLHHDNDTEAGLREKLSRFTALLADRHDALPRDPASGQPRWAFIHGNWALDNSHPTGRHCGVDNELIVLREEGCYADFTFPAAPDPCQTRTINRIYYAKDDPQRPKSHDTGARVRVGGGTAGDLMLIQGPLGLRWRSRKFGIFPRIENADVRASCPPTPERIDGWVATGIHVEGRPEWTVVKVHTHGAEDADMDTLLGPAMHKAYAHLETRYNDGSAWKLHYVSAREAYNIARAAEAGLDGDPGDYRDYAIARPGYDPQVAAIRRDATAAHAEQPAVIE